MTADQFWNDDPWLVSAYRELHSLKNQQKSEEMWMQGLYFYNALGVALGNAFAKKGTALLKYMEQPIRVIPLTEEEKEKEREKERKKTIDYFNRLEKEWERCQVPLCQVPGKR